MTRRAIFNGNDFTLAQRDRRTSAHNTVEAVSCASGTPKCPLCTTGAVLPAPKSVQRILSPSKQLLHHPEHPRGAVGGPRAAEAITGRAAHAPPTPPTAHHGLAPRTTHSGAALGGLGTHGSAGGGRRQRHLVVGVVGGGGGGGGHGHHHRRRQEHQHERPRGRPRASPAYLEVPHDPS